MAKTRITEVEKIKIGNEIQRRAKALAILDFDMHRAKPNAPSKVSLTLNMKSKASYYYYHYNLTRYSSNGGYIWGLTNYEHLQTVVQKTRLQYPKCMSIPDHYMTAEVSSATPEDVEWAKEVMESLGISEETGSYKVTFEAMVPGKRVISVFNAVNSDYARMKAIEELNKSPLAGWLPRSPVDSSKLTDIKLEKM